MLARRLAFLLATILMTNVTSADAQTVQPIRHTLRFPAPQTNRLEVTSVVPTAQRADVELMMAVWTPGSYLVREYSRNVEGFKAAGPNGRALAVVKTAKNRWRVSTDGAASVTVTYQLYAREMTPRHDWVEASFALINGAPTYMTIAGDTTRPHEVTVVPATGWARVMTSLPEAGAANTFRAANFDELVDSPILVGNPDVQEFRVDGKLHYLVTEGGAGQFDSLRAVRDLEKLAGEHRKLWGSLPVDQKYIFFNILTYQVGQPGGALEHANSVLMMNERAIGKTRQGYNDWLELASHEYFHLWNVKRLRPIELGPFDYEREVLTRSLWIAEGVTDYYGALTLRRAGFISTDEYLRGIL